MKNKRKSFLACIFSVISLIAFSSTNEGWKVLFDFSASPAHFAPPSWKKGLPEWPATNFYVNTQSRDWRKYDRLIIELINDTTTCDMIRSYIGSEKGSVQKGLLSDNFLLPYDNFARWTINLEEWPKTTDPANVGRVHIFQTRPTGTKARFLRMILVEKGATPPPIPQKYLDYIEQQNEKFRLAEFEKLRIRKKALAEKCKLSGQKDIGFWTGFATSMEKIRPRNYDCIDMPQSLYLRLAKNEHESFQMLVTPSKGNLKNVSVSVSNLKSENGDIFSSSFIDTDITGYVNITGIPPYKVTVKIPSTNDVGYTRKISKPEKGWWPDPIINFLDEINIEENDLQSFWIRVNPSKNQPAGIYKGIITVSATLPSGKRVSKEHPLTIRVNNFIIPEKSPLPLAITFAPSTSGPNKNKDGLEVASAIRKVKTSAANVWKKHENLWANFLADYFITVDSLYHRGRGYPKFDILNKLKKEDRLGYFNLGYWGYPKELSEDAKTKWRETTFTRIKPGYDKAKELGLLDKAYIYGCDEVETNYFENVKWAISELKKEFPGVPISTTAYDDNFGIGSALSGIDWFTPHLHKLDVKKAEIARKKGHKVWWYFACSSRAPWANMFVECTAIESRLFFGAQTVRMRPDGFLYYQISIWNSLKPITEGPFTDWDARSWRTYHGDGSWTCAGEDGKPLSTQRLENFRDGLEDYAYAMILEEKLKSNPNAPWAKEAKELIAVPNDIMENMTNYTLDPQKIYKWRDRIAELIEEAK
jgi:hypothetical protein